MVRKGYKEIQCMNPGCKQGNKNKPKYFPIPDKSMQRFCCRQCEIEGLHAEQAELTKALQQPETHLEENNTININVKLPGIPQMVELVQWCGKCFFENRKPEVKITRGIEKYRVLGTYFGKCPRCGAVGERGTDDSFGNMLKIYVYAPKRDPNNEEFSDNANMALKNAYNDIVEKFGQ